MQQDHFQKKVLSFWPHPRGRGCAQGHNICLYGVLCSIPFNLICNMITFRKKNVLTFWPHPWSQGYVCEQNICYHVAVCFIHFNLICNITIFQKTWFLALVPPPRPPRGWVPGLETKIPPNRFCITLFLCLHCKISVEILRNDLVIAKFKYLTFDPTWSVKGGGGGGGGGSSSSS